MKKLVTFLLGLFVLTGCGGGSSYDVAIVDTPVFIPETASPVSFSIAQNETPAAGLEVTANFEMEKMDHGSIEVALEDKGEGMYGAEVTLPMGGDWQALLLISNGTDTSEELVTFTVEKAESALTELPEGVFATINGAPINKEDVEFYKVINKIQVARYREADQAKYEGAELEEAMKYWDTQEKAIDDNNNMLNQIIRLRSMALLAEEKGHEATENEIKASLNAEKNSYAKSEVAQQIIQEFGEEKFWTIQENQHKLIVLQSKVQQDIINNVKEANPEAKDNEVMLLAEKKYEELLVSQVGTLDIKINKL